MLLLSTAVALLIDVNGTRYVLTEDAVRRELRPVRVDADDLFGPNARSFGAPFLIDQGVRCHDGLLAILEQADRRKPGTGTGKGVSMYNVFNVLTEQRCDRRRFLPYAEKYALTDEGTSKVSKDTRAYAIKLLGQIGTADHVEKLVPLIHAENAEFRREAFASIRNLGDRRHAQLVLDQLGVPRPNLPPLSEKQREEIIGLWNHLKAIPTPDKK